MNHSSETTTTTVPPDELSDDCGDFVPVPREFINYASLPMLALILLISFTVRRKRLWPGCCKGRPGILIPMNLIGGKNSRMALSAAFAILTSRLMRLLLFGDKYWSFPRMDDPEFADKLSFLSILIKIFNSVQLSLCFYPMFVCIIHGDYIILNILGYLTMTPWFYYTVEAIRKCSEAPVVEDADLYILLVTELPEFIAYAYLIWYFSRRLYINIFRRKRRCECTDGAFDLTRDDEGAEPVHMVYVRGLLQRKERTATGLRANVKESLTYRKIPGLRASPRILITLTVSAVGVYSLTWSVFRVVQFLEVLARHLIQRIKQSLGVDPAALLGEQLIDDYIMAFVYGCYACSFLALICAILSIWRVYVNYRSSVRRLLRGDKSVYHDIDMSPANMMVYASKYPGFQIAFTVYGYIITFFILFIVVVVIFTYLLVLPLKWGTPSLVWILIKGNWQTILVSLIIYYAQVIFAKFVFFDRETGTYDNRRLFCVTDYFLFFFNALLSLFTSLKRIVMSMVIGVIYLTRLDQSGMMRGFERFDNGHKSFIAMLHVEVTQNNPIVLSFIELLSQDALKRRVSSNTSSQIPLHVAEVNEMTSIEDLSSLRHRWAENRWQRAFTLINNHSLVVAQLSKQALENLRVEEPLKKEEAKDSIE